MNVLCVDVRASAACSAYTKYYQTQASYRPLAHLDNGPCCQYGPGVLRVMHHGCAQVVKCPLVVTQPTAAAQTTQNRHAVQRFALQSEAHLVVYMLHPLLFTTTYNVCVQVNCSTLAHSQSLIAAPLPTASHTSLNSSCLKNVRPSVVSISGFSGLCCSASR